MKPKTVKILGMGRVLAKNNGVSRDEYFDALRIVSKWNGLAPFQVDEAISNKIKELNT